jgi:3-oxoacyl-[acyl-carrier-protein] synthase II
MAMAQAQINSIPDVINAHGTGTILNDRMECVAIRTVFGRACGQIPVTSTKPLVGHMSGAAGIAEAICVTLAMESGEVAPTIGLEEPERGFSDIRLVVGEPEQRSIRLGLSMNSGFGGTNAAMLIRHLRDEAA